MRSMTFSVLMAAVVVQAHMELSWPPPFRSKYNPHTSPGSADYSMTGPLSNDGSNFPCKGYHTDMKDITGAGAPVATWNAGSNYNFTVVGGADHHGGSCQGSLSYDGGNSFKVIHSFIGDCPRPTTGNFDFTVPSDAKPGNALFAWTWFNQIGNRELYMNCASVTIASTSGESGAPPKVPFSSRPDIFVANIGNGCTTVEGKDTIFPDPGPDVTRRNTGVESTATLSGNCPSGKGNPAQPSKKLGNDFPSFSSNISGQTPIATSVNAPATTSTASPHTSGAPSSNMKISANGECGDFQTCSGSIYGQCCSKFGYCGDTTAHCGTGCENNFGDCGMNATAVHIRIRGTNFR